MRYRAIATDYDGTLATDGVVDADTLSALRRYRDAGGRLLMVTGRVLADLQQAFPQANIFDGVVAENGAVFFQPATGKLHLLSEPPPEAFVTALMAQQVAPIHRGHIIVSTWQPHGETVQRTIEAMRLESQIILNKRAIMVLPEGVNKATGLRVALDHLGLVPEEVVGIGDAENDYALLQSCGLGVAVENALPSLKAIAQRVTTQPRGLGVAELAGWLLSDRL
ncbi:MAG: HAD family hydrolase [Elainellaceae cyanobacterium]